MDEINSDDSIIDPDYIETDCSESSDSALHDSKSKKRAKNVETWKQNKRKLNRNSGIEYVSTSNKVVPARSSGACSCVKRCTEKFSQTEKETLLQDFNNLKDKNIQDAYLFGLISKAPVGRYGRITFNFKCLIC